MRNPIEIMQSIAEKEASGYLTTELGIVTAVFPHSDKGDKNNYQCTITLKNKRTADGKPLELKMVPVAVPYMGMTCIPNVNDLVIVNFIGGDINAPVITGRLYNDKDRPPVNKEKEFQIQHSLQEGGWIKIDPEGVITLTSKNEKNIVTVNDDKASVSNGKMTIEVDFSSEKIFIISKKDIEMKADGAITIEARELNIKTQAAMKLEAGSSMDIKSSAPMKIKGATIDLN
jgi:phage baseplate assembly protein gpV